MRRNLRLDWRALALLGALLSIIIEWPGLLVYAMPTIFQAVSSNQPTAFPAAATAHDVTHAVLTATEAELEPDRMDFQNISISNNVSDSVYLHTNNTRKLGAAPISDGLQSVRGNPGLITDTVGNGISDSHDRGNQGSSDNGDRLATVASREDQLHNSQRIKMLNSITNKRKRKKPNDDSQEEADSREGKRDVDGENGDVDEAPARNSRDSISNEVKSDNNNEYVISNIEESNKRALLGESTTAIYNNYDEELMSTVPAQMSNGDNAANHIDTTTIAIITSDSTLTVPEESHEAPLQPPAMRADAAEEKSLKAADAGENVEEKDDNLTSFAFSSSHHVAILSRTERSLDLKGLARNRDGSRSGIVRRSSDVAALKSRRLNNSRNTSNSSIHASNLDRNERSTISHLSGPSRKIQLYIKNRFIQLLPDGTVNGTQDDQSEYTILQRSTVDIGRIKIQSVATCLYLCMDPCGAVYGSKDFTDDCVFNENMEQHNYNTYSSTYNSNARRVYYLALNRHGDPRRLQIPSTRSLGKLATYTNAITETVAQERVEQLIAKNFGENRIKHGIRQLCDTGKPLIELIDTNFKARPTCNPSISVSSVSSSSSSSLSSSNSKKLSSSNSSSSSSSSSSNSSLDNSSNGQLLNNVPAANDKSRLNSSSSGSADTNSNSSSSSISISNSQSNSGHISSSSAGVGQHHSGGLKKKKKRRKCRPFENEEEHSCQRGPLALRRRGNHSNNKQQKCKEQQSRGEEPAAPCGPKRGGPRKNGGAHNKKVHNGQARASSNNRNSGLAGPDGLSPGNRRGKKMNGAGRQGGKNAGGGNNKKRGGKNQPSLAAGKQKKQKKHQSTASTTATTTTTSMTTTTTASPTLAALLAADTTSTRTTTPLYNSIDPRMEATSARGERERNVRFTNFMESPEESAEDSAEAEDDDDANTDADEAYDDEPSSSHVPFAVGDTQTQLSGGADDFLYYDQSFDFLPMGLWEMFALLWITLWCIYMRI